MPNVLYVSGKPIDRLTLDMNKKYDHQKWIINEGVIGLSKLGEYINNIPCVVMEIIGTGLYIKPDLNNTETLRWKWEDATRSLLRDTHATFGLLMNWLSVASNHLKQWKNVLLDLYKEDISHRDFIEWVKEATDGKKYAEWLTLEIVWDARGTLTTNNVEKLWELSRLGVWIGIGAFDEKSNWEIDIRSIRAILRGLIIPKFIKISNIVLDKIKNNRVSQEVHILYVKLVSAWFRIIEVKKWIIQKEDNDETIKRKTLANSLVDAAKIEYEPMFTFEWKVWCEEMLVRFDGWMRTDVWLTQLKEFWHTKELMIKMLQAAVEKAKKWKRVSLNLYIKDLWSDNFMALVNKITLYLPKEYRKYIIFEILEERYGIIDEQFFVHAKALQDNWFILAIDDLYIWENNTWMSKEILDDLLLEGIYPDIIKLDGKHSIDILNSNISAIHLKEIKTLIWQFTMMRPTTTIVAEWIQNMKHAKKYETYFRISRK